MRNLLIVAYFIQLCSCSTENKKVTNQNTKPESYFELKTLDNKTGIKISSEKYNWSKTIDSKKESEIKVKPKTIVDSIKKVVYLNLFAETIYSINLEDGSIRNKVPFPNIKGENIFYSLDNSRLTLKSPQDLFIFDKDLKLIADLREGIEVNELSKAGAIFGDTIDAQAAKTPQNSILFGSEYYLDSISIIGFYQDSIKVLGHYSEGDKSDTAVKYMIELKSEGINNN